MIEAVQSGICDLIPWCKRNHVKFLSIMCLLQFVLAIPMIMQSGIYWVTLIDWYASGLPLMLAAGCEIICISWIYGVDRFIYDLKCMIGYTPKVVIWFKWAWRVVTPIVIVGLVACYMIFYTPAVYNGERFPAWAEVIGWLSMTSSAICIPAVAAYQLKYHPNAVGTFWERVKAVSRCEDSWGPNDPNCDYKYRKQSNKGQELIPMKDQSATNNKDDWNGSLDSNSSPPPSYDASL